MDVDKEIPKDAIGKPNRVTSHSGAVLIGHTIIIFDVGLEQPKRVQKPDPWAM